MFLITSLSTTSIKLGTGTVFNLPTYEAFNVVFKLFKVVGTINQFINEKFLNFSFKDNEVFLAAKYNVSRPIVWSNSF